MVQENIDESQKKADKFEAQYNKLRQEFKDYIESSKKNEEKKRLEIKSDISKRLLVVADSLTRIINAENTHTCEYITNYSENIKKNLGAVYTQMLSASGLIPIEPGPGDTFDEQKYIAIGLEFDTKYPDNTVFKVIRKGYFQENNIVRPAEVIVTKNTYQQKAMKSGIWNRFVRIFKHEKVNISEIKRDVDELKYRQNEHINQITLDIESIKNSIKELDVNIKQTTELRCQENERMDRMMQDMDYLRNTLREIDFKKQETTDIEQQMEEIDDAGLI